MKAEHFRLGNLVYGINNGEKIVLEVSELISFNRGESSIEVGGVYNVLEPIPLTEEWLLKFGFKKGKEYWLSPDESAEEGFVNAMCFDLEDLDFIITSSEYSGFVIKCEYVHRLQNLYFSLTGEELKINL